VDAIVDIFESRRFRRGGILFQPQDAIDLIEAAREQRKPILDVDAFIATDTATQPFLEHSTDYSDQLDSLDTWSAARQHIEQRRVRGRDMIPPLTPNQRWSELRKFSRAGALTGVLRKLRVNS
jgi:hypothetical protein